MGGSLDQIISADDHVQEHPNVWLDRLSSKRWGNRIPHIEEGPDATEYWVIDEQKYPISQSLISNDGAQKPGCWSSIPRWAYDPGARLKAMDVDGASFSVLYPSVAGIAGERFGQIRDPELRLACVQAYNDWLIEEWASISTRFIPQCIVPLPSVEAAVTEITRSVSKGHKGVLFPARPLLLHGLSGMDKRYYDPSWKTCEELDVPLCLHSGCTDETRFPPYPGFSKPVAEAFQAVTRPLSSSFALGTVLFSGILLRHPRLKLVFADCPVGWGLFFLEALDYTAKLDGLDLDSPLAEIFRRQCFIVFSYEKITSNTWKQINPENLLWSSHFPLFTSTWPNSRAHLRLKLAKISPEDRAKIVCSNSADLYSVSCPALSDRRALRERKDIGGEQAA